MDAKYLLLIALTGCASHKTITDTPDPELRVRVMMPLCLQDCQINVTNAEGVPIPDAAAEENK